MATPSEADVVASWLRSLNIESSPERIAALSDADISSLYEWCCQANVEAGGTALLKERLVAVNKEAAIVELRLETALGVRCEEIPAVQDLARCAAALGANQVEPALLCGAVADLQDEIYGLDEKNAGLGAERVDLLRKGGDVQQLKALLTQTEEAWIGYVQRRSQEAAEQQHHTGLHLDKVEEYHRRLEATQSRLAALGMTESLTHSAQLASFDTLVQQAHRLSSLQTKTAQYKVPPNINMAQAKLAQLRAEVKDLQMRLPRNRRIRQH